MLFVGLILRERKRLLLRGVLARLRLRLLRLRIASGIL
jgi:hypothetical protein